MKWTGAVIVRGLGVSYVQSATRMSLPRRKGDAEPGTAAEARGRSTTTELCCHRHRNTRGVDLRPCQHRSPAASIHIPGRTAVVRSRDHEPRAPFPAVDEIHTDEERSPR